MFHVGDVIATTNQMDKHGRNVTIDISSISNYVEIYNMVKKLKIDIYSDMMYPNAKRPSENLGYHSKYTGL